MTKTGKATDLESLTKAFFILIVLLVIGSSAVQSSKPMTPENGKETLRVAFAWLRFLKAYSFQWVYCSTSLPISSSRSVRSTIELCTVHSQSSAMSINLGNIKFYFEKKVGSRISEFAYQRNHTFCCSRLDYN